jgi:hypothetical protein
MSRRVSQRWWSGENAFRALLGLVLVGFVYARVRAGSVTDETASGSVEWVGLGIVGTAFLGLGYLLYHSIRHRSLPFREESRAENIVRSLDVRTWTPGVEGVESQTTIFARENAATSAAAATAQSKLPVLERIQALDGYQFERLVQLVMEARGFTWLRQGATHPDHVVDLIAERGGRRIVVHCLQWHRAPVKPDRIRELIGARTIESAEESLMISPHGFTSASFELASRMGVELVGLGPLVQWVEALRLQPIWPRVEAALDARKKRCPKCDSPLIQSPARKGTPKEKGPWTCQGAPRCRFVLEP